jgi:hypothetical protein
MAGMKKAGQNLLTGLLKLNSQTQKVSIYKIYRLFLDKLIKGF